MIATQIKAKIVQDMSGVTTEIPVILTDEGVLESVVDYVLQLQLNGYSHSLMKKCNSSIILLITFMNVNKKLFDSPEEMFSVFVRRLYSGTVGDNGLDPSGLYWIPTSTKNVYRHICNLTNFTTWMSDKGLGKSINKLRTASSHEQRMQYAAWFRRNQHDFLGHIKDKSISNTVKRARSIKGRSPLARTEDDAIAFPNSRFKDFYLSGVGGANDHRIRLRDKLISILIHGAGLRICEALSLWVTDVFEDHTNPDLAIVRIYNEIDGRAPERWKSHNGSTTRKAYLLENFARLPRQEMLNTQHLGWKSRVVDHRDGYLEAYFFPAEYRQVFMSLWRQYLAYRAAVSCHHPYAFISFETRYLGTPYTQNAFNQNYAAGLRRIGLQPNKAEGLDPHGHRHNYGRRLSDAGLDPLIIKKCLHHKNLESQTVYTMPSNAKVSSALSIASEQLQLNSDSKKLSVSFDWEALTEYGFKDIDPDGLLTGKNPRLKRCEK